MANKLEIELPDKLKLFHRGSHMEIIEKWFGAYIVIVTVFAIIFGGNVYTYLRNVEEPMEIYFRLIAGALGIGCTYAVVAAWFNRTHILVGRGTITVRHRPIPWFGNKELKAANLKQLYVKERIWQREHGQGYTYEVHAVAHSGRNIRLVSGLRTSEQALYIEQEIEKYLGIEDISVTGEFSEWRGG